MTGEDEVLADEIRKLLEPPRLRAGGGVADLRERLAEAVRRRRMLDLFERAVEALRNE